jgi:hypothetical protein
MRPFSSSIIAMTAASRSEVSKGALKPRYFFSTFGSMRNGGFSPFS